MHFAWLLWDCIFTWIVCYSYLVKRSVIFSVLMQAANIPGYLNNKQSAGVVTFKEWHVSEVTTSVGV